jgi:hypothetical protein
LKLLVGARLRRPAAGTIGQLAFAAEHYFSGEANGHRAALVSETSFSVNAPSENIAGSRIRTRPLHGRYIGAVPAPQISGNVGLLLVGVAGFEPATPSSRTSSPLPKSLKYRNSLLAIGVNAARTFDYFCAVSDPNRAATVSAVTTARMRAKGKTRRSSGPNSKKTMTHVTTPAPTVNANFWFHPNNLCQLD